MTWWTKSKERTLAELYPKASRDAICAALPAHSWDAIRSHASKLKIARDVDPVVRKVHPIIGELIARRREQSLSQDAVAQRIGMTRAAINNMECGRYLPHMRHLEPWCAAFGLKLTITEERQ